MGSFAWSHRLGDNIRGINLANSPPKIIVKVKVIQWHLSTNLHRLISAAIGPRVTSDPAELPFLLGGKSCTQAPLNIIPKFPKGKNASFSQIYHQNPAHLCVPYVWLLRDTKCFLENFVNQKMAYVTNRLQKDERWQRLLLGDWPFNLFQAPLIP